MPLALGFDFGLTRIGIATGQTLTQTATPLTAVVAKNGVPDWDYIATLMDDWKPDIVVVGLPLHEDGSTSEMAERAKRFGNRIELILPIKGNYKRRSYNYR